MTTQVTGSGVNFNGSTSGTILLTQPAVAGSNTITLPAETGTLRTTVSTGTVLQVVNYTTGAAATGTTLMPYDDTIPQITEGVQYMSLAITPRSASSTLNVSIVFTASQATGGVTYMTVALFRDATANALGAVTAYTAGSNQAIPMSFDVSTASGSMAATTFYVRAGTSAAGTSTFNGNAGARLMGGVYASSITITEVVP